MIYFKLILLLTEKSATKGPVGSASRGVRYLYYLTFTLTLCSQDCTFLLRRGRFKLICLAEHLIGRYESLLWRTHISLSDLTLFWSLARLS